MSLTPEQWLQRLGWKLQQRREKIERWQRYVDGDQDIPEGPSQHRDTFRKFQKKARTNLCHLCVQSMVDRTKVIGYRDGSTHAENDKQIWKLWQDARLDARQFTIYRRAYALSASYVVVGEHPSKPKRPRVTIEHPLNVIVETDPADASVRIAALRLWFDSLAKRWFATLYLPGIRYGFQSATLFPAETSNTGELSFQPQAWEQRYTPQRSTHSIPVVPFLNGEEGEAPRSAFDVGIDIQDRLNLTLLNRLTAERYAAFRQRWAKNLDVDYDSVTGLPIQPYKPGVDQIWIAPRPDVPAEGQTEFGDFAQTDTTQILRAVEADMRAFAAITLTPVYYLPGDLVNIGADAVAALDAGHIAKVKRQAADWGESLEEVTALMAEIAGIGRDLSQAEVVWERPENFNLSQVSSYVLQMRQAGYPLPLIAEDIGKTPQQVDRLRAELSAQASRNALAGMLNGSTDDATAGSQPGPVQPGQAQPVGPDHPSPGSAVPGSRGVAGRGR